MEMFTLDAQEILISPVLQVSDSSLIEIPGLEKGRSHGPPLLELLLEELELLELLEELDELLLEELLDDELELLEDELLLEELFPLPCTDG